jgi:AAA15 family ATPase/GTPase
MKITKINLTNIRSYENVQIEFSPTINLIIGENNSGKTTILKSILLLQDSNSITSNDIRINQNQGRIGLSFNGNIEQYCKDYENAVSRLKQSLAIMSTRMPKKTDTVEIHDKEAEKEAITIEINNNTLNNIKIYGIDMKNRNVLSDKSSLIMDIEPENFIYPFLSKRKVTKYNEDVGKYYANKVSGDLSNLYAKVDSINTDGLSEKDEYVRACEDILGFRISSSTADRGKKATYVINNSQNIPLELMGEGVANILGLIIDLCVSKNKLFLIEEPENDIHPKALKKLLKFIVDKSESNQFIITTHSNIVLKYLGSAQASKIFQVKMNFLNKVPTSIITEIDNSPSARREILEDLGYELFDFDIWDAWLILEESSAETVIRDFIIPNFVPELKGRLKTCSSQGVDKVPARIEALYNLCLFLHLHDSFKDKIWVLVDGGENEEKIIKKLKDKYKSWTQDRFCQLKEHDFERYYPKEFQETVDKVLNITDRQEKKKKKEDLLKNIKQWWTKNPDIAKEAFSKSAHELIEILKDIEKLIKSS